MFAYLDSSVLLRIILDQKDKLDCLSIYKKVYSSRLIKTECMRTLNRLLLESQISEVQFSELTQRLLFSLVGIEIIGITESVLEEAEEHFPRAVGTLDAIHLSSAISLTNIIEQTDLEILTHDTQLGKAALALGMKVVGI